METGGRLERERAQGSGHGQPVMVQGIERGRGMDLGPCKFTDASSEKDAARIAVGMGWKPPAGHASWCWVERTPWDRAGLRYDVGGYSRGNGKPFSRACVCGKSDLSRHIRKLEALAGAR